ncbi:hypothetical protein [Pectinatus haikarae]|uniref:hypothetical protein n=1 Tax=Pectinatus haikarae TaxID=349096 RepID=UPI0018C526B8|nr:hypothetical protein [Pectinatus haikarae]
MKKGLFGGFFVFGKRLIKRQEKYFGLLFLEGIFVFATKYNISNICPAMSVQEFEKG